MKKYRVFVRGENLLMYLGGCHQKIGFFADRFVEARDEEASSCAAVDELRADPGLLDGLLNQEADSPLLYAEEIEELKQI